MGGLKNISLAVRMGNLDAVSNFLANDKSSVTHIFMQTLPFEAAQNFLRSIYQRSKDDLEQPTKQKIINDSKAIIQILRDKTIEYAIETNDIPLLKRIKKAGASLADPMQDGTKPFDYAKEVNNPLMQDFLMVEELLEKHRYDDRELIKVLQYAFDNDNPRIMQFVDDGGIAPGGTIKVDGRFFDFSQLAKQQQKQNLTQWFRNYFDNMTFEPSNFDLRLFDSHQAAQQARTQNEAHYQQQNSKAHTQAMENLHKAVVEAAAP